MAKDLSDAIEQIDYEKDQREQGLSPEVQAGAGLAMHFTGTPQGYTGIKYWDEKKEITPYDAYLAKKYNDITFTGNLNINANTKTQSVTKLMGDISQTLAGLENLEKTLELGEKQAGFWSGIGRKLNHFSGGIIPISEDNARYQSLTQQNFYNIARGSGGKITNAMVEDFKKGAGGEFKSPSEQAKRQGETMRIALTNLGTQIEQLERQGHPIPPLLIWQWNRYNALAQAATTQKNFQYSKWWEQQQKNQPKQNASQAQSSDTTPKPYTKQ